MGNPSEIQVLHCPACGYDLRGAMLVGGMGRCPECGEVVDAGKWEATKLEWEHRQSRGATGRLWLFVKTVVLSTRQPQRLAGLAPVGVRPESALKFRRWCVAITIVLGGMAPLIKVQMGQNHLRSTIDTLSWTYSAGLEWIWPGVVSAALVTLLAARASYEGVALAVRGAGREAAERARTVAPFLTSGFVLIAAGVLLTVLSLKWFPFLMESAFGARTTIGKREVVFAAVLLSLAITPLVVGLLTVFVGPAILARGLAGVSRRRALLASLWMMLCVGVGLPLCALGVPIAVGLGRMIVLAR